MEVYRHIKGYEELYMVSNKGNVKSCERSVFNGKVYFTKKEQILTPKKHPQGYQVVCLSKNNQKKYRTIHRLVAEAFIENPDNKKTINHKDCNKKNNNIENLEWATYSENAKHAQKNGLCSNRSPKHEAHNKAKLNKRKVREIRDLFKGGYSRESLAIRYNVCKSTIQNVITNKTWIGI